MLRVHPPGAYRHRPVVHCLDAQLLEPLDRPHDVQQRVYRPDLVQVDLLGRHAMHSSLGLAQQLECAHRALTHPGGHGCALDQLHQLRDGATVRLFGDQELDLLATDARAAYLADGHPHAGEAEPAGQPFEPRRGETEGQETAEGHVATDAGGGIDDGNAHLWKSSLGRATRRRC